MALMAYAQRGEWHIQRYIGRHRGLLERKIGEIIPASGFRWLDWGFGAGPEEPDWPLTGPNFLPEAAPARRAWKSLWPGNGIQVTWDAVAELTTPRGKEWLVIDAKSSTNEMQSNCPAKNWKEGLSSITDVLGRAQVALQAPLEADWLRGHYQFASRLAGLYHLVTHHERVRLLQVFFCGDRRDGRHDCPQGPQEWASAIAARDKHLALPAKHRLSAHIHELYLDVCPR